MDQVERRHITGDHRSGADQRERTDPDTAANDHACTEGGTVLNHGRDDLPRPDPNAGNDVIRKDRVRADEAAAANINPAVDADAVLDPRRVANRHVHIDIDIASQRDIPADRCASTDVAEMPNSRARGNFAAWIEDGGLVHEGVRSNHLGFNFKLHLRVEASQPLFI